MSAISSEASFVTAPEESISTLESLNMDIFERMFGGFSAAAGPPGPASAAPSPDPSAAPSPDPASAAPSATPSSTAAEDVLRARHQNFLNHLVQGGGVGLPGNYRAHRPVVPAPNVQPPD
ncbi:MAG: hypothetical protein Q9204_006591, partial [Flavoplaca sp. TL-2023a]